MYPGITRELKSSISTFRLSGVSDGVKTDVYRRSVHLESLELQTLANLTALFTVCDKKCVQL